MGNMQVITAGRMASPLSPMLRVKAVPGQEAPGAHNRGGSPPCSSSLVKPSVSDCHPHTRTCTCSLGMRMMRVVRPRSEAASEMQATGCGKQ